jgi:hypothetical protein
VKLRLHGTPTECDHAARRLVEVFDILAISGPYSDRGPSRLVRVYLELRLDPAPPAAPAEAGQQPPRQLP